MDTIQTHSYKEFQKCCIIFNKNNVEQNFMKCSKIIAKTEQNINFGSYISKKLHFPHFTVCWRWHGKSHIVPCHLTLPPSHQSSGSFWHTRPKVIYSWTVVMFQWRGQIRWQVVV